MTRRWEAIGPPTRKGYVGEARGRSEEIVAQIGRESVEFFNREFKGHARRLADALGAFGADPRSIEPLLDSGHPAGLDEIQNVCSALDQMIRQVVHSN